jgi:hypothetical protein
MTDERGKGLIYLGGRVLYCPCGHDRFERFLRWWRCERCQRAALRVFDDA